jgi:hypothetical protein
VLALNIVLTLAMISLVCSVILAVCSLPRRRRRGRRDGPDDDAGGSGGGGGSGFRPPPWRPSPDGPGVQLSRPGRASRSGRSV